MRAIKRTLTCRLTSRFNTDGWTGNRSLAACLTLLMFLIITLNGFSQDPDFHVYLAFGQSNMEGGNPKPEAQDLTGVDPRFQLLPAVDWPDGSRPKETWTTAIPPLCRSVNGLCPCDYFGRTMVDSLPENIKIGVFIVAVGGCAIEMFDKDKYQSYIAGQAGWMKDIVNEYGGNPYARLVEMGKLAQEDGVIKGFLFHQGESGSTTGQWANEVKKIYNDLIKDLDLDATKIPLLAGDLLNPSRMVQDLPKTLENAYVISSQGLTGADMWHFSAEGYRELGRRYAYTMLEILREQNPSGVAEGRANVGYALGNGLEFRNGMTSLSFEIPKRAFVSLKVYTLGGREIVELAGAEYADGKHTLEFRQKPMATGVFVLKMKSGPFSAVRTILVAKQ